MYTTNIRAIFAEPPKQARTNHGCRTEITITWNYPFPPFPKSCTAAPTADQGHEAHTVVRTEGHLFEARVTLRAKESDDSGLRQELVMQQAIEAAREAAETAKHSGQAEGAAPFTLLVGQSAKTGASANVLDPSSAGRLPGTMTLCSFSYGGEAVDEGFAQRFAAYDVVCFSRFPNNSLLRDLQRLLRKSHRYCMLLSEGCFPSTGVMLASKARITKTVVPAPTECYSQTALDRITRQSGGAYACLLDVSPIFENASLWLFHCLLFFNHSFLRLSHA